MDQLNSLGAIAATLLAALVIIYHLKKFTFWSSRGIRGPVPWPIFGTNIYYLFGSKLKVDASWRDKYGKVYGIYEGYSPTLRVMDNELIKNIYIKEFSSFTDRNKQVIHNPNAKRWLLWTSGDYWANQRAIVSPMFTSKKMRSMFSTIYRCVDNFLDEANARIKSQMRLDGSTSGEKDEIQEANRKQKAANETNFIRKDLMNLTLDVIAKSFFSIKLNTYRDNDNEFSRRAYEFSRADFGSLILWLLTPNWIAEYFQIDLIPYSKYRYFDELSRSIVNERRRQQGKRKEPAPGGQAKPTDLIQAFLDAKIPDNYENIYSEEDDLEAHYNDRIKHDELEKIQEKQVKEAKYFRNFNDDEICGSMTFLFIAGFDTTASTMNFCLYELSHQPSIQEELFQELNHMLLVNESPDTTTSGDLEFDYAKLSNLTKLDAFVSEILRLYSVILDNNRTVTAAAGVTLPTSPPIRLPHGTVISTNFFMLQRDPDYFERPTEFDMTRFYPENRDNIKSCTYMPFGLGPRNCAGMRFALLETKLFLAKVLLKYTIAPGPKTSDYPPKFEHNMIFLEFKNTDFKLLPR